MGGICGYIGIKEDGLLERMTASLKHRGPDNTGYFQYSGVGLGHSRLSIIDVEGGRQPIENEDGSLILICNGEIYNYQVLREGLLSRGHQFRTKSDSEVILHLYEEKGPECLSQLNGMFAIAIYDKNEQKLFLARDRLGIKPLYYVHFSGRLLFASEFKSILRYKGFDLTLDPNAVHHYLALRYVPGPGGMFKELKKVPAAHYIIFQNGKMKLSRYWTPDIFSGPFKGTEEEYIEGFAEHFEKSVKRRLISEVPLGAYLSGGLDSSVIVAAMSKLVTEPIRTFSVGFDYEHDELVEAASTAEFLGCKHTEIACRAADINLLPEVIYHLDEPVGDAIVIPMYQLSREAKKHVTVILTGEGADEILGGYLFHKALLSGHRMAQIVPRPFQKLISSAVTLLPSGIINLAFDYPAALGNRGKLKVLDFLNLLEPHQLHEAYRHLISLFDKRDTEKLYTEDFRNNIISNSFPENDNAAINNNAPYLNRILDLQFPHWLPDDILMKQDKVSMAHAVEGRVPFLDHELVEYALKIPPSLKIKGKSTKYILRQYAKRVLPENVVTRKKMPFFVPMEKYFSEPVFQEFVRDTLSEQAVRARGIFRFDTVSKLIQSMDKGEFVFVKQVFSLVVLELWFRMAVDRRGVA